MGSFGAGGHLPAGPPTHSPFPSRARPQDSSVWLVALGDGRLQLPATTWRAARSSSLPFSDQLEERRLCPTPSRTPRLIDLSRYSEAGGPKHPRTSGSPCSQPTGRLLAATWAWMVDRAHEYPSDCYLRGYRPPDFLPPRLRRLRSRLGHRWTIGLNSNGRHRSAGPRILESMLLARAGQPLFHVELPKAQTGHLTNVRKGRIWRESPQEA